MSTSFQFASISHELRSALANIAQLADQLSNAKEYDDGLVSQIKLSSSFLLRIVEGLIDEDRNLKVREASLDKMIEEVVSTRTSDDVQLDIWISPDVPLVMELCDIVVSRIIRNIIHNTDSHSGASKAELRVEIQSDMLVIRLKDDGYGIDLDKRGQLFSPLNDTEIGHGIGLFLCALLAEKAGGQLICVNPEAGHCTFELKTPFKSGEKHLKAKAVFVDPDFAEPVC